MFKNMCKNTITIFHSEDMGETYERYVFDNVFISKKNAQKPMSEGGTSSDNIVFTIFCNDNIKFKCEDYVYIGKCNEFPGLKNVFVIYEIYDNRQGHKPLSHYRVVTK